MSDYIISVNNYPTNINVNDYFNNITVTEAPIRITVNENILQLGNQNIDTSLYYLASNPSGFVTSGDLAGVRSINGISGILVFTGLGGTIITIDGNIFQISGVSGINTFDQAIELSGKIENTGSSLDNKINSLSGYSNGQFATIFNLQTTGSNLYNFSYPASNPSGYISNSGFALISYVSSNYATNGALDNSYNKLYLYISQTGTLLNLRYSGISGSLLNTNNNLSQTGSTLISLITAASAGVSALNGLSGILSFVGTGGNSLFVDGQTIIVSGDSSTFITVENLTNTGNSLYNLIVNSSGQFDNTGSNLDGKINSLSGYTNGQFSTIDNLQNTGQSLYNLILNESGQFNLTGTNLNNKINSLSGYVTGQVGSLTSLIILQTGGVRTINNISGNITLSTSGNLQVTVNGNTIFVSTTGPQLYIGSGSPEGVQSAVSGSIYTDWFNTQQYNKITGNAAYGWR